jgi:hypothetical protein
MQMSVAEIRRTYSQAKDKKAQISILSDLNLCSEKEILNIVCERKESKTEKEKEENTWVPTPEQKALIDRLEELDGMISKLEKEYQEVARKLCEGGEYEHDGAAPER